MNYYISMYSMLDNIVIISYSGLPGAASDAQLGPGRVGAPREFKDVAFEDVVFDNNRYFKVLQP